MPLIKLSGLLDIDIAVINWKLCELHNVIHRQRIHTIESGVTCVTLFVTGYLDKATIAIQILLSNWQVNELAKFA